MRRLVLLFSAFAPPAGVNLQLTCTNEAPPLPPLPPNRGGTVSKVGVDQQEGVWGWPGEPSPLSPSSVSCLLSSSSFQGGSGLLTGGGQKGSGRTEREVGHSG